MAKSQRRILRLRCLALVAALSFARGASAHGPVLVFPDLCGPWIASGLNLGAGIHPDPNGGTGFLVGAEVSYLRCIPRPAGVFLGAYADALHDGQSGTWRFSIGPEAMYLFGVGFDMGPVVETSAGSKTRFGVRFRYFAPLTVLSPYVDYSHMFAGDGRSFAELGLLLKLPLPTSGKW